MNLNGKRLKTMLILNDMTQRELTKRTGLSYSTVCAVCTGGSCSRNTAERIAEALGVPVEKLEAARRRV